MRIDVADDDNMDMAAHEQTYRHFVSFVKFSIAAAVAVLIGMAVFLT